jgi:hypothetical protein
MTNDWAMTKAKQAYTFSQVPEVRLSPKKEQSKTAIPVFAKVLNDTLKLSGVGAAMNEIPADVFNAAGIGIVLVSYESTTELVNVPVDPLVWAVTHPDEAAPSHQTVEWPADKAFRTTRISPSDLLVPTEFKGSDFDSCAWIGHTARCTWAEARRRWNLTEEQRGKVCGTSDGESDALTPDTSERADWVDSKEVEFDELWYKSHLFDAGQVRFAALHHLVFVRGIDKPVVDQPWAGQKFNEQSRSYLGACRFPLRCITVTYISDESLPPSDTAIGRSLVDELGRSRSQMLEQREYSKPMRWANPHGLDKPSRDNLRKGNWQDIIWTNGMEGSKVMGELARASYPREDFEFNNVATRELREAWSLGENQSGAYSATGRSASEANITQTNFQTLIGYERARFAQFYVGISEVMAGLLALYGDFTIPELSQEDVARLGTWDREHINQHFEFSVRVDSTVLLDATARTQQLLSVLNYVGNAPPDKVDIDVEPILREIVELNGLDADRIVRKPQPKGPKPLNMSLRNAEDVAAFMPFLVKSGQAPSPEDVETGRRIVAAMQAPIVPMPLGQSAPPAGFSPTSITAPIGAPPEGERTEWTTMPRINSRNNAE